MADEVRKIQIQNHWNFHKNLVQKIEKCRNENVRFSCAICTEKCFALKNEL